MKKQRGLLVMTAMVLSLLIVNITSSAGSDSTGILPRSPAASQNERTVRLAITVTDEEGKAISDAHINVYLPRTGVPNFLRDSLPADYQENTNARGIATIEIKVDAGQELRLLIEVSREDFQTRKDDVRLGKDFPVEIPKEYALKPRPKGTEKEGSTTTFKVRVVKADGEPVQAATVEVVSILPYRTRSYSSQTDRNGNAVIVTPMNNEFQIKASKESFGEARKTSFSKEYPEQVGPLTLTLEKPTGSLVTIHVTDQETKNFVAGAKVILDNQRDGYYPGTTDNSGNATFIVKETGRFAVRISQEYYEQFEGEARLLAEEENQTFGFTVKAKPKKTVGPNSIDVTVLQGDRVEKIAGYNLPLPDASVTAGNTTEITDRSGRAKISGDFEGNVEVVVEASGYKRQVKVVRVAAGGRLMGSSASLTFLMQPEASEDSIEVSVFTTSKNNEGSVPLAGATVSAGEETATTNANGRAKLTGSFEDSLEVAVEKGGYLRQTKTISASGGKGSAVFTLQPEPEEDSVTVSVMGQDAKGGSAAPIAGALVSANGLTQTTNNAGQATITGNFKNGVEVEVKARGFITQAQQVSIALPARTGLANFTLLAEPPPLRLIVEVRDSAKPNNPLAEATVYVHDPGKPVARTSALAVGKTNNQGEASLEVRVGADDLDRIQTGLKLEIVKDKYVAKLTDITKDLLLPSAEPRRVTVFLSSDWADLRAAVDALEPRVLAWNNDLALAGQGSSLVQKLVEQSTQAKQNVATLLKEIDDAVVIISSGMGALPANHFCIQAARLRSNIEAYKAEADAKEQALKTQLDNASALSATCSSVKDVDGVRAMYRSAIQLAAAIGELEKKAVNDSNLLTRLASQRKDVKKIIAEGVEKNVAGIRQEAIKAETAASTAQAYFTRADNLNKSLYARHNGLSGELASLKGRYGLDNFVEGLPSDLNKRVELMTQLLGKHNNNIFGDLNPDWPSSVQGASAQIQADKERAEALLARYKSIAGEDCEIESLVDLVQEIEDSSVSATTELAAANDLANKCTESVKRGGCAPVVGEVRNLMQQGAIAAAEAKVREASASGCDVTGLDEEIDYYRTLYEAVALLKNAQNNCRFQEALDFAHRMPVGVQEKPLMRQALADAQEGLNALMATRNLLEQARQAGVARNISEQDRFLAAAQSRAQPYACLTEEVNNFKRNKKLDQGRILGAPVNKPDVEEIPDNAIKNAREAGDILAQARKKVDKPEVEEIPEEALRPSRSTDSDEAEETSEGFVKTKPASLNWTGTWTGSYEYIVHISGAGDSISATYRYEQVGASGSGQWSNCRVTGNTAECDYTGTHDDATKSGTRRGKVKVTLSGDTMTGTLYEDTPQWSYKPGYSAANVSSAMFKGAEFYMIFKRQ